MNGSKKRDTDHQQLEKGIGDNSSETSVCGSISDLAVFPKQQLSICGQ